MGLGSMFDGVAKRLLSTQFDRTVLDEDGEPTSTGVDALVQELVAALQDRGPIRLSAPLEFIWEGKGAAIVVHTGDGHNKGFQVDNSDGQQATLGIGQNSTGVIANELVPDPNYFIARDLNHEFQSNTGDRDQTVSTSTSQNRPVLTLKDRSDPGFGGCGGGNGDPRYWRGGNNTLVARGGCASFFHGLMNAATANGGTPCSPTGLMEVDINCGNKLYLITDPTIIDQDTCSPKITHTYSSCCGDDSKLGHGPIKKDLVATISSEECSTLDGLSLTMSHRFETTQDECNNDELPGGWYGHVDVGAANKLSLELRCGNYLTPEAFDTYWRWRLRVRCGCMSGDVFRVIEGGCPDPLLLSFDFLASLMKDLTGCCTGKDVTIDITE